MVQNVYLCTLKFYKNILAQCKTLETLRSSLTSTTVKLR
ncbi:MAG: hypothetical protein K0S31_4632, partial [Sphingobacterium multivorum]|nr:hypothetical protein [Sphingobacterium multivorum]